MLIALTQVLKKAELKKKYEHSVRTIEALVARESSAPAPRSQAGIPNIAQNITVWCVNFQKITLQHWEFSTKDTERHGEVSIEEYRDLETEYDNSEETDS